FGLPESTVAGFVSGTSAATFCGLVAARNHTLSNMGWDVRAKGLFNAPRPRIILGDQAHSTVFKALSLIGFGMDDLERVPCDSQGQMRADRLPEIDNTCIVIAQARNVNTGAFDPLEEICDRAKDAWIHVDGAFGLWAAGSPDYNYLVRGMEKADSWSVDAHKTLNTPYDSGIVLCRHPDALVSALQNSGDYIIYGEQRDPMLYTQEMSRRARG
ncbi:MAG: aspartate aminotransferase family protein, partial [Planctomycetes bacterium]|nr:aspartate aminotransferase family protein [Planctomycetota bacterium]